MSLICAIGIPLRGIFFKKIDTPADVLSAMKYFPAMLKLTTFLVFFIAALFVPLWPLLAVIGLLYLAAWIAPSGGDNPPNENNDADPPETPPPTPNHCSWRDRYRAQRRSCAPFLPKKTTLR
jgi:hypothetical protein